MKFWLGLFFVLGFGAGYGGYFLWKYDQQPVSDRNKEEDVRVVLGGRGTREPTATPLGMLKYEGQYLTFMYPAKAKKYPLAKADGSILERVDLEIKNPKISIIALAYNLNEKYLDEVPGVKVRRSQPEKYKEQMVQVGVEKNPVFTTIDGKEKIVFVMYHDRLYTLSVVGTDPGEVLTLWQKILPTFHFI